MNIAAATNLLWLVASLSAALYIGSRLKNGDLSKFARSMATGIVLVAIGGATQATWWTLRNIGGLLGYPEMYDWFFEHRAWTSVTVFLIAAGYGWHMRAPLEKALGRYWLWVWLTGAGVLFAVTAYIA